MRPAAARLDDHLVSASRTSRAATLQGAWAALHRPREHDKLERYMVYGSFTATAFLRRQSKATRGCQRQAAWKEVDYFTVLEIWAPTRGFGAAELDAPGRPQDQIGRRSAIWRHPDSTTAQEHRGASMDEAELEFEPVTWGPTACARGQIARRHGPAARPLHSPSPQRISGTRRSDRPAPSRTEETTAATGRTRRALNAVCARQASRRRSASRSRIESKRSADRGPASAAMTSLRHGLARRNPAGTRSRTLQVLMSGRGKMLPPTGRTARAVGIAGPAASRGRTAGGPRTPKTDLPPVGARRDRATGARSDNVRAGQDGRSAPAATAAAGCKC